MVYAVPGRSDTKPAGGATLSLLGTSNRTTADATGRFVLEDVRVSEGQLLITFDADADGTPDRQKVLELKAIGAGLGRDIALGEVALGQNATAIGRVLRGDTPSAMGHGGTTVFVPGAPYSTATGDDGSFTLENLPEGMVQLAFFREGFEPASRDLSLTGGSETRAASVTLDPASAAQQATATATGTVTLDDGSPASGATVRLAVAGSERAATTSADGRFSLSGLRPSVYQLAVERPLAVSLRLYNLLLASGENELGPYVLSPGVSMSLPLDGGLQVADAGPPPAIAVIDPLVLDVEPGALGSLSGGRSTGVRPLTYHWAERDGGQTLSFTGNDTASASLGRFVAPDGGGLYPVELRIDDALGRTSSPASALVRVGKRPIAAVVSMGPSTVTTGDIVTLSALGSSSTDGRPLVGYLWSQVSGPYQPELAAAFGPTVQFAAPVVPVATPMSIEVRVVTDVGIESAPIGITLVVQPPQPWDVVIATTPSQPAYRADGGDVVRLTASIVNAPPQGRFAFQWSPTESYCLQLDGGRDFSCSMAWQLSNGDAGITEFIAPRTDGPRPMSFMVTATNTTDGTTRTKQTQLTIDDRRPPAIQNVSLTQLAFRFECDEDLGDAGSFSTGPGVPPSTVTVFNRRVVAQFKTPMGRFDGGTFTLSGLTDRGGNAINLSGSLVAQDSWGPLYQSNGTSTQEAKPRWVSLPSTQTGPPRQLVVGRRIDGSSNRMAWAMEPDQMMNCPQNPCTAPDTTGTAIPGAGMGVPVGVSAVSVGQRAYVAVSTTGPASIMELDETRMWKELTNTNLPYFTLGSDGSELQLVALEPPSGPSGGLRRYRYNTSTQMFTVVDDITTGTGYSAMLSKVHLTFTPNKEPVVLATDSSGKVTLYLRSGATFMQNAGVTFLNGVEAIRGVAFDRTGMPPKTVAVMSTIGGQLDVASPTLTPTKIVDAPTVGFDVASFGSSVLVAFSRNGRIFLWLIDPDTGERGQVLSNEADGAWNGTSTTGDNPTLTIIEGEVFLAWQEKAGAQWSLAGRRIQ